MSNGCGQIISPLMSGTLNGKYGFRTTCDVIATIIFSYFCIYFVVGGGIPALGRTISRICASFKSPTAHERLIEEDDPTEQLIYEEDRKDNLTEGDEKIDQDESYEPLKKGEPGLINKTVSGTSTLEQETSHTKATK